MRYLNNLNIEQSEISTVNNINGGLSLAKALELQLGEKGPVGISPYGAAVLSPNQLYRGLEVRACLSDGKIFPPGQTRGG